eukprot:12091-Heterococcus_DN1.PRE.5
MTVHSAHCGYCAAAACHLQRSHVTHVYCVHALGAVCFVRVPTCTAFTRYASTFSSATLYTYCETLAECCEDAEQPTVHAQRATDSMQCHSISLFTQRYCAAIALQRSRCCGAAACVLSCSARCASALQSEQSIATNS